MTDQRSPVTATADAGRVVPILPPAPEPWLTKKQAATHLGRSTRWVELRMAEDGLPFRRVKRVCMYRRSELDAWVLDMDTASRRGGE
jgi:hypothetical protein